MTHFGLATRPRCHTRRQVGMGHPRQLEPTFYPGRAEIDPLIPHTVQLPLDSLMVSTRAALAVSSLVEQVTGGAGDGGLAHGGGDGRQLVGLEAGAGDNRFQQLGLLGIAFNRRLQHPQQF